MFFLSFSNYCEFSWTSLLRDAACACIEDLTLYFVRQIILKFCRKAVCLTETKELLDHIKLKVHILSKTMTRTRWFTGRIFLVPLLLTSDLKHVSYITFFFFFFSPPLATGSLVVFIHINNTAMQRDYCNRLQKTQEYLCPNNEARRSNPHIFKDWF